MRGATESFMGSRAARAQLQSTPHMRGATTLPIIYELDSKTSIHAPHAWGDRMDLAFFRPIKNFNPRPTCVGRQRSAARLLRAEALQSTPHMRGATGVLRGFLRRSVLQSTPHMRGATKGKAKGFYYRHYFNPRPTCVGRL